VRNRLCIVAALLALLAIAIAGCADSGGGGDGASAKSDLSQSLGPQGLGKLKSGVVDGTMKIDLGGYGSGSIHVTGPFDSGSSDLTLNANSDLPGLSGGINGEMVTTPDNLFIVADGTTYELGTTEFAHLKSLNGAPNASFNGNFQQSCRAAMQAQGIDPSACSNLKPSTWLGDVSDQGDSTVDGVNTKHLQAEVDVKALVTDLITVGLQALPESQRSQLPLDAGQIGDKAADYIKDFHIDVYRADDGIPRRIGASLNVDAGGASVDFSIDATIAHANEAQTISPPSGPTQPMRNLARSLPGPWGGLFDCLTTAKSRAELQACATRVGFNAGAGSAASSSTGALQVTPN
jgi:hypothetical protein